MVIRRFLVAFALICMAFVYPVSIFGQSEPDRDGDTPGYSTNWSKGAHIKNRVTLDCCSFDSVSFSPDGRYLTTAGQDGRVIIWEPNV